MAVASTTRSARAVSTPASRVFGLFSSPVPTISPHARKSVGIGVENRAGNCLWRLFKGGPYDFPCGAAGHFARGNTGFLPLDKMGAPSSDILSGGGASL